MATSNQTTDTHAQLLPALVVEKNLNGTFIYIKEHQNRGVVRHLKPSAHLIRVGEWITVTDDGEFQKKIDPGDFRRHKIPTTLVCGPNAVIISNFVPIADCEQSQNEIKVWINNLGKGVAKREQFPTIQSNGKIRLGIFEFPRNPERAESSESTDTWRLIEPLETSLSIEDKQKMRRTAAAQIRETATEPRAEQRVEPPKKYQFGRQIEAVGSVTASSSEIGTSYDVEASSVPIRSSPIKIDAELIEDPPKRRRFRFGRQKVPTSTIMVPNSGIKSEETGKETRVRESDHGRGHHRDSTGGVEQNSPNNRWTESVMMTPPSATNDSQNSTIVTIENLRIPVKTRKSSSARSKRENPWPCPRRELN